jgi:hypothetical protein
MGVVVLIFIRRLYWLVLGTSVEELASPTACLRGVMDNANLELDDLLQRVGMHYRTHTWRSAGTMSNHVLNSIFRDVSAINFSILDAKVADVFYGVLIASSDQSNKEHMATLNRIGTLIGKR